MKLYHSTLEKSVKSIEREGILLNKEKSNRKIKGYTDLFNYVFNKTYENYLPERVPCRGINRDDAIFLSAHPNEFRKSEHLLDINRGSEEKDVVYECSIEENLPVFSQTNYEEFPHLFSNVFNESKNRDIQEYIKELGKDEIKFSNLITYFLNGNYEIMQRNEKEHKSFEDIRRKILEVTEFAVKKYCMDAITTEDLLEKYEWIDYDGEICWANSDKEAKDYPWIIKKVEILSNKAIPPGKIKRIK